MKNVAKNIDKILKEEDKLPKHLKAKIQKKKEIIDNDKTVRK